VLGGGSLRGLVAFCRRAFFIWVECLRVGSGLVQGRGMSGWVCSFAEECQGRWRCGVIGLSCVGGFFGSFFRGWEALTDL